MGGVSVLQNFDIVQLPCIVPDPAAVVPQSGRVDTRGSCTQPSPAAAIHAAGSEAGGAAEGDVAEGHVADGDVADSEGVQGSSSSILRCSPAPPRAARVADGDSVSGGGRMAAPFPRLLLGLLRYEARRKKSGCISVRVLLGSFATAPATSSSDVRSAASSPFPPEASTGSRRISEADEKGSGA